MAFLGRCLGAARNTLRFPPVVLPTQSSVWNQYASPVLSIGVVRHYAARRGTREKKQKIYKANKLKNERKRAALAAERERKLALKSGKFTSLITDDSWKSKAVDNVWIVRYHKWPVFSLKQAVENIKESHHPTMYNLPNALIQAYLELDMTTKKKTEFVEKVTDVIVYPNSFESGKPRSVFAFCKTYEQVKAAMAAGATNAQKVEECIKDFESGLLDDEDFEYFVAHTDALADLGPLRGILLQKYPRIKSGTVGTDIADLVSKYQNGVLFSAKQDANWKELGIIETYIGPVKMETEKLEENFKALVEGILKFKAKNSNSSLIVKGMLRCQPSPEWFKLDLEPYVGKVRKHGDPEDDIEDDKPLEVAASSK